MRTAALLLLVMVGFSGCTSEPKFEVPAQDADGRYIVNLTADNTFVPERARVPVGATVVWHVDGGSHDVSEESGKWSSYDGKPRDSFGFPYPLDPGDEYNRTFEQKQTLTIWCHRHHEQGMKMELKVG